MSNPNDFPYAKVLASLDNLRLSHDSLSKRLTRIETRLTQLMVFEGMQTDGRREIVNQNQEQK